MRSCTLFNSHTEERRNLFGSKSLRFLISLRSNVSTRDGSVPVGCRPGGLDISTPYYAKNTLHFAVSLLSFNSSLTPKENESMSIAYLLLSIYDFLCCSFICAVQIPCKLMFNDYNLIGSRRSPSMKMIIALHWSVSPPGPGLVRATLLADFQLWSQLIFRRASTVQVSDV